MGFDYNDLCKPARYYFYLAIIFTIFSIFKNSALHFVIVTIIRGLFILFLDNLCRMGFKSASWGIFIFIIVINVLSFIFGAALALSIILLKIQQQQQLQLQQQQKQQKQQKQQQSQ